MDNLPPNPIKIFSSLSSKRSLIFVMILLLTLIPRLWLSLSTLDRGLSVDELQAVTHAYLPLNELFKSVSIFDHHPPLYYLQLHIWLLLGNTSDIWIKLNPLFWSVLTGLSIYAIAGKIYGFKVGILASILYAISPYSVADAQTARMYAMIACIGVWVFFFTHQFIVRQQSLRMGMGVFLSTLAFLYSHGAGFIILISSFSYALLLAWQKQASRSVLTKWGIIQIVAILFYVPWLIHARKIIPGNMLVPTITDIAFSFSQLLFGVKIVLADYKNIIFIISFLLECTFLLALSLRKGSRSLALSFIVAPITICVIFSYLVRPIWITRVLAHIIPFMCMGMAIAAIDTLRVITSNENWRRMQRFGFSLLLGVFIVSSILGLFYQQSHFLPWSNILPPVQMVEANASYSDVVYIPNVRIYWGWCWYYIGPGSVNPINTNYDNVVKGVRITSGNPGIYPIQGVNTYWLVYRTYDGDITDFLDKLPAYYRKVEGTYRDVIVERLTIIGNK